MLETRGVTKVYETGGVKQKALNRVRVNFRESEFVAVLGPSGSGKTTLLNIIGGLDEYSTGDLIINEKSTKRFTNKDWDSYRNHRVGFIFQSYNLIPHQTILNNVRLALTLSGISKTEGVRRAKKALKDVGLGEQINKKPAQLSGGQMQRVAIARALVNNPDIVLADEPTGALDSETSVQVMELLKKIAKDKLVIMVTHNPELAKKYATRTISIKDGKIIADTNPYDGKIKTDLDLIESEKKSKKTKMSFLTSLGLSFSNLMTKRARTILVALAGSIGIIGIALISAVSTGFQNYIDTLEEDTLTSYPLALRKEATDITSVLLNLTEDNGGGGETGKVRENQIITSTMENVSENDLKSFKNYFDENLTEIKDDVRLVENEYNVEPVIYSEQDNGKIQKLNPSNLFASVFSGNLSNSAFSSMTSVYKQYERENMENDFEVLAGRYPENYDEMVVVLPEKGSISDLLVYSLGLRDTKELSEIVTKVMSGESVDIKNEPMELDYEDLMGLDLRLVYATDLYKYSSDYEIYEDMSEDENFVRDVYNKKADKLKIVGVLTAKEGSMISASGVLYLPELVTHVIERASGTEAVKKQLDNPELDIFSGKKFGEEKNDFSFEFSDLVSVDEAALSKAFGTNIDQSAVTAEVTNYMNNIATDIDVDTAGVKEFLINRFKNLNEGLADEIVIAGEYENNEAAIRTLVDDYLSRQSFGDLTEIYFLPEEQARQMYSGLLQSVLKAYAETYVASIQQMTGQVGANAEVIPVTNKLVLTQTAEGMLAMTQIDNVFQAVATPLTEARVKKNVLTKVTGLTTYLTNTFSSGFRVDQNAITGAFHLKFSEEELTRVVTAMFTDKKATLDSNLVALGYQKLDEPSEIAFYFNSFDGKTRFMEFLDDYNNKMELTDKDKVISYTDTTGILMSSVELIVNAVSYVLIAFVSISLIVSSIMIGVITYISVYERTKEIGILRAMGASKHNISEIFNAETFIIGLLSGLMGVGISYLLIPIINAVLHVFIGDMPLYATLAPMTALILIIISVALTLIGGLIPAKKASNRDPVEALRSE